VAQITQEAGVAKGTFFNYFGTKHDLLIQVIEGQVAEAKERLHDLVQSDQPLTDGLIAVMVGLASPVPYTQSLVRAMFHSALANPENVSGHLAPAMAMVEALTPVIAAGQERGEFRGDLPPDQLAFLVMQTYFGALWAWSVAPVQEPLAERIALSYRVFFEGTGRTR